MWLAVTSNVRAALLFRLMRAFCRNSSRALLTTLAAPASASKSVRRSELIQSYSSSVRML